MTIYFGSSEDIDFLMSAGASVNTSASKKDGLYARSSVATSGNPTSPITADWTTQLSTVYVTYRQYYGFNQDSSADLVAFTLSDGGTEVFKLQPTNGVWSAYTVNSGWVLRDTFNDHPPNSTLNKITVKLHLNVAGSFEVWLENNLVASWTGDTIGTTGATGSTKVRFNSPNAGSTANCISEVVVSDGQTINMRVASLAPSADGTNTAWTGDWSDIDETADSATDTISTSSADVVETTNVTNYAGDTDLIVLAVFVSAKAVRGASGPQNLQLAIREGTTEAFSGTEALTAVYTTYKNVWTINPDTAVAWTVAELDTLESGVKSIT